MKWLAILAVTALAGCLDTGSGAKPDGPEMEPSDWVHANGEYLAESAWLGEKPHYVQRQVWPTGAGEPTIGIGPDGTVHYIALDYTGELEGSQPLARVLRSMDDGASWVDRSPSQLPIVQLHPFSGDPFVHTDRDTGRVFAYQQYPGFLACPYWSFSDDRGESWTNHNNCDEPTWWGDHPSMTTGVSRTGATSDYQNVVYFCATIGDGGTCRVSLDGGATYGPPTQAIERCGDNDNLSMGPATTTRDGVVMVGRQGCGKTWVGRSLDDGQTWTTHLIDDTTWQNSTERQDHEVSLSADDLGRVYAVYMGPDDLPRLSVSQDGGESWQAPIEISEPTVTGAMLAYVAATGDGQVAVLYMGTTDADGRHTTNPEATWSAYVAHIPDASADSPIIGTVTANPSDDPLRRGPCNNRCHVGPGPLGAGELQDGFYDFLDIEFNPATGAIWVALVDLCNEDCGRADGTAADPAYGRATVGVQVAGFIN